jgi:hypothetical protein
MKVNYLFSGADVSGRDLLLTRTSGRKLEGVIARAVTAIAISATAFTVSPGSEPVRRAASTEAVAIDMGDTLLERVWKVRSDGIQPSDKSRRYAATILEELRESGVEPDRVVADPDGGVAIYVFGKRETEAGEHARHARLLAANEGDVIALCVDYERNSHDAWAAELTDLGPTVRKVHSFVAG